MTMSNLVLKVKKSKEFTDFEKRMLISGINLIDQGMVGNVQRLHDLEANYDFKGFENSIPE